MPELIAAGTTQSAWTDFDVTTTPKALYIKPATGDGPAPAGAAYEIAHKTPAGTRAVLYTLTPQNQLTHATVAAPGPYSARRMAGAVSSGLDVEG